MTVQVNTGYMINDIDRPQNDNNIFGYLGNTLLAASPYIFTDTTAIENATNTQRITRFLGSVEVEYVPIDNLRLRASVGFDGTELRNDGTFPANLSYFGRVNGERSIFNRRNEQYTYDLNARYSYTITPSIQATSIIGGQAFNRIWRTFTIVKQNFSSELIMNVGAGADFLRGDEGFLHTREAGLFAQQEFAYQNRIFFTVGLRRDFASAIGFDTPSIYYPKASFAIRLDQFAGLLPRQVNFLKLRAAYGEAAQMPGLLDGSHLRWRAEPSGYGAGAVLDQIGNPEIEPERIREFEIGIETEWFKNLGLELTYYIQRATDSIIDFNNVPSSGLTASAVPFNVGASHGSGFELSISATPLRKRHYSIDLMAIWNYQKNEVQDLGGAPPVFSDFDFNVITEGLPRDAFYTFRGRPTFDENGEYSGPELVAGLDEDGQPIREFLGTPYPEHNGSISANIRFLKNFNLNVLSDFMIGNEIFNNTAFTQVTFGGHRARNVALAQLGELNDAAKEARGVADVQGLVPGTPEYNAAAQVAARTARFAQGARLNGNFVERADYFKLREISLRYDFTDLIRKIRGNSYVKSLSFTLSARNLWTTSNYSGLDPEVNFTGGASSTRQTDFLTLPSPRVIYGTLNIGF